MFALFLIGSVISFAFFLIEMAYLFMKPRKKYSEMKKKRYSWDSDS